MGSIAKVAFTVLLCGFAFPNPSEGQQRFSCSYGDQGACLGYGETVCSSRGKCVDDSASCFDSYQCNYEGFTCKSNVTACIDEYDDLVVRFNDLLSENDDLVGRFNDLVSDYNEVLARNERLQTELEDYEQELEDTQDELWAKGAELDLTLSKLRASKEAFDTLKDCVQSLGDRDDPSICLP